MFWDAVTGGLGVLTYWQTYVAGLEYLAVYMVPMGVVGFLAMRSERAAGAIGCLSMLVLPVLQVFAIFVFVLTLSPIILGLSPEAAWGFPWMLAFEAPGSVAKFVGLLLIAALVLAFVPILGRLQSLHTLVLGALGLALVLGIIDNANPGFVAKRVHFWPGFWFTLGLLVIGAVLAWIGTLAAAALAVAVESKIEGFGQLLMFPIGAIFGFIPVFMYGAWLGAQLPGAG
jgi:hypothetical protein